MDKIEGESKALRGILSASWRITRKALKLNPQMTELYQNRGVTYLLLSNFKEAEADLTRYRELGGTLKPEKERLLREVQQKRLPTAQNPN